MAKKKGTRRSALEGLPTREEREAAGKELRSKASRSSQARWEPPKDRRDPVDLLVESSQGRIPQLLPIRYGRMMQTPFAFFRGAAAIMAADLATTPSTGVHVQACGDCHLLNFGGFATPERRVVFDINDFDETSKAPWEWDVKRLAASFVIAGRNNGFTRKECRTAAAEVIRVYREKMAEYAGMPALRVWYSSIDLVELIEMNPDASLVRRNSRLLDKAMRRDPTAEFPKLTHIVDGRPIIKDDPPLVYHMDLRDDPGWEDRLKGAIETYRGSLPHDRQVLFDRYRFADLAMKVVGVGSVGTMCSVALFLATDDDPLFLQVKEARTSVLEPYAGKSPYANRGQRVVVGQQLTQGSSDIFLGWTEGKDGRHFYLRQLRDVKIKPTIEIMKSRNLVSYAFACGWALARAHARSGDASVLAGYMGSSNALDQAIADFAESYADQNERDHAALVKAVGEGRLEAAVECI